MLPELQTDATHVEAESIPELRLQIVEAFVPPEKLNFQTEIGRISRQSGIVFAGTIFTAVLGYIFKIYLARTLGAESLGVYALAMAVVGFVGIFGGLGLTWAASRFPPAYISTGRMEDLRVFIAWSSLTLISVNALLTGCIVLGRQWISIRLYHTPALGDCLKLFSITLILGALTTFFAQLLTGYKEVAKRTIITTFIGAVVNIAFAVALLTRGMGLRGYILAQIAGATVVLILLAWSAHQHTPRRARFTLKVISHPRREIFSFAAAAFAMDIVAFLYSQTDKIILGFYLNARAVGVYAVAATIVAFVPIMLQSVNQIFSPMIAELHERGDVLLLNRLFQTSTKWITALTFPLALVVIIFSRILMRIFGHDFEAGWIILVIGAAGQLINCATGPVGYLLLMSGNEKKLVRIQSATAVFTVIFCLLLVPRFGIGGAAIAAAIANISTNVWCLFEVKKSLGLFPYNRSYWGFALPAGVTLAATVGLKIGLRSVEADIAVVILSTALAYGFFLGTALLSGLDADDRLIARAISSRLRDILAFVQVRGA